MGKPPHFLKAAPSTGPCGSPVPSFTLFSHVPLPTWFSPCFLPVFPIIHEVKVFDDGVFQKLSGSRRAQKDPANTAPGCGHHCSSVGWKPRVQTPSTLYVSPKWAWTGFWFYPLENKNWSEADYDDNFTFSYLEIYLPSIEQYSRYIEVFLLLFFPEGSECLIFTNETLTNSEKGLYHP